MVALFYRVFKHISWGLQRGLIALIVLYRYALSPWLGCHCRFSPSCSRYAQACITHWGVLRGSWLGFKRLCRCHPWGPRHAYDPPPPPPCLDTRASS